MLKDKRVFPVLMAWALVLSSAKGSLFASSLCTPMEFQYSPFFVHYRGPSRPTLVVIHGGFSSTPEAATFCNKFSQALGDRYNIVSVDYRFSSLGGGELIDVERGIQLARRVWKTKNRDIHLIGASHGGYLALMAACKEQVGSVIDAYGPTQWIIQWRYVKKKRPDLLKRWSIYLAISKTACQDAGLSFSECLWDRSVVNPSHLSGLQEPILVIHGDRDRLVPLQESITLTKAVRKRGGRVILWIFHGKGHGFPLWSGEALTVIERFLRGEL